MTARAIARSLSRAALDRITEVANRPRRDSGVTRAIYSYPAKFQAHLPAELIRMFSAEGDLVVDPYVGGGTTALEAVLARRSFFGVDLSPFAILLAGVKTTKVAAASVRAALLSALASREARQVLDEDDVVCLGTRIAGEIARFAAGSDAVGPGPVRDLLRVALIHAVKIAGRRDFDGETIEPLIRRRAERIVAGLAALPADAARPRLRLGSCVALPELADGAAALVVTSPPYKDLDVEYGLLQLQRPRLGKSKRSRVIWSLLQAPPVAKSELCGGRGATYWDRLAPALAEIRRVLVPGAPAFFWTGFKSEEDRDRFGGHLAAAGLPVVDLVPARLSRDRVASSRSDHHGRPTGMLKQDYLIVCGGEGENRTPDTGLMRPPLCRLSYPAREGSEI
jgi:hypothetical protein